MNTSKKMLFSLALGLMMLLTPVITFADQWVNGYYRSNGTYVNGYYRSSPDGNPYNNYSYPGNTNPYTGKTATGNTSTYLDNYYNSSYKSPSYSSYSYTPTYYTPSYSSSYTSPSYSSYGSYGSSSYEDISGGYKSYGILFCDSGYYESGNKCKKAPAHGEAYGGSTFYCDEGYSKKGNKCMIDVKNSTYKNGVWTCKEGSYLNNEQTECVNPEKNCQETYGKNSHYANNSCYKCDTGLILDPSTLSCNTRENSPIKASGCPVKGGGTNVYTGAKCKK